MENGSERRIGQRPKGKVFRVDRRSGQRRKGPDLLVKLIHWLGIAVWILAILVLFITDKARPEKSTIFDRLFNIQLRTNWNLALLYEAFFLMVVIFALSVIGIFINTKRHQRKDDHYSFSLIVMGSLSLLGILVCLYFFWR